MVTLGYYGAIYKSIDRGWHWNACGTSITYSNLSDVYFADSKTGFIVGNDGTILKTTDQGASWQNHSTGGSEYFEDVHFIDTLNGFAVGYGIFSKTTDGGNMWQSKTLPFGYLSAVSFSDEYNGFIAVSNKLLQTSDGGITWDSVPLPNCFFRDICFTGNNTVVAAGSFTDPGKPQMGLTVRTTDGGLSWSIKIVETINELVTLDFVDSLNGFAGSYFKQVYATTDGGINWFPKSSTNVYCQDIDFLDIKNGYAAGLGIISRTTDGGVSWSNDFSYFNGTGDGIGMIDTSTGIAVGGYGSIIRLADGGITDVEYYPPALPHGYSISQNYPNPFNPFTTIRYSVVNDGYIVITVYDALGTEVKKLVNEKKPAGEYELTWNASGLPSGVYFYRIQAGSFSETRKMILIK